ncbi:hypothetical protein JVT61DRAFT_2149 [Boletus reticuloceps]|uniref:RRM domain-containing protein n=1 Tax=Boletus reticuloceps TaxID=495285 RepID=A0A8I3ABA9_9AGAM|nr:hypothetical protein JVT61DRAFT_2149 [Boletus reticuloceps]
MEDGTKAKKTIFVGGLGDDVDESVLYESFSPFGELFDSFSDEYPPPTGDIVEVQLPPATTNPTPDSVFKHRGFAFVTYGSPADAQDAIDNMDLNELRGRVIKVNIARPIKAAIQPGAGNRAGTWFISQYLPAHGHRLPLVWESEDWLRQYAKPLAESGGVQGRNAQRSAINAGDAEAPLLLLMTKMPWKNRLLLRMSMSRPMGHIRLPASPICDYITRSMVQKGAAP